MVEPRSRERNVTRVLYPESENQDDGTGARPALKHVFASTTFLDSSKLTSFTQSY